MPSPKIFNASLKEWEDAGSTFANALDKYLCLSLSLRTMPLNDVIFSNFLATRIDSALDSFNTTLAYQISQAKATLALTRNKILSPMCRLPEEILSGIFHHVIYAPLGPTESTPMMRSLVEIYDSLYTLIGVCSTWKKAVLARGSFWSTIPVLSPDSSYPRLQPTQAMQLSLDRARGADLHLVAIVPQWSFCYPWLPAITKHASQFRTANIASKCSLVVGDILALLGGIGPSSRLSELTVQRKYVKSSHATLPSGSEYIFKATSSHRSRFDQLLNRLSVFRLCGAPIHWDQVAFSNQLVELELQGFTLGLDSEIAKVFTALSSATKLRHLAFISLRTFPTPGESSTPTITLPKLQTLVFQDLYINTFSCLLSSINSRSHRVTLHLTEKTFRHVRPGEHESPNCDTKDFIELLSRLPVTKLLLDGDWISTSDFRDMFTSLPNLETLWMHCWEYDHQLCEALSRPLNAASTFPCIKNLHITYAKIRDVGTFKSMLTSYSGLERMELGTVILIGSEPDEEDSDLDNDEWGTPDEDEDFVMFLKQVVPRLELIDFDYLPKEFCLPRWQLR